MTEGISTLTCSDFLVKMLPTALVKNEASKGFKGDSDSIKVKSFSSRTSSWLIAELIWGTSHIKISEATWGNLNREISSTSGGGSVVIRLINSDRISGLVKLKKRKNISFDQFQTSFDRLWAYLIFKTKRVSNWVKLRNVEKTRVDQFQISLWLSDLSTLTEFPAWLSWKKGKRYKFWPISDKFVQALSLSDLWN